MAALAGGSASGAAATIHFHKANGHNGSKCLFLVFGKPVKRVQVLNVTPKLAGSEIRAEKIRDEVEAWMTRRMYF